MPIMFKPRKELLENENNNKISIPSYNSTSQTLLAPSQQQDINTSLDDSLQDLPQEISNFKNNHSDNDRILTENNRYKLVTLPPILKFLADGHYKQDKIVLLDDNTDYGIAITQTANNKFMLHFWNYRSLHKNTSITSVPFLQEEEEEEEKEEEKYGNGITTTLNSLMVIFTWPTSMEDKEQPGLCVVNKHTGILYYFDELLSSSAVDLDNNNAKINFVQKLDLKLKKKYHGNNSNSEYVTNIVNIEPCGVLVSTSLGKLILVGLKDFYGKPLLSLKEYLINTSWLNKILPSQALVTQISSIFVEESILKGQKLVTSLSSNGELINWKIQSNMKSIKNFSLNIYSPLIEYLKEIYPYTLNTLEFLDCHKLANNDNKCAYVILSRIQADVYDKSKFNYILSTIIIGEESNSFDIFSTYRLNTYFTNSFTTKLHVAKVSFNMERGGNPDPYISIYVLLDDAIVLLQVDSQLDFNYPFKRKWEDIISFKNGTMNLSYVGNHDSSVLFINSGIDQVLKLDLQPFPREPPCNVETFIKSHIDQDIYFHRMTTCKDDGNPVEFNIPSNIEINKTDIENDLKVVAEEIWTSKSPYIPPIHPVSRTDSEFDKRSNIAVYTQHLKIRLEYFEKLLNYMQTNFGAVVEDALKLALLNKYEIMACCYTFLSSSLPSLVVTNSTNYYDQDEILYQIIEGVNNPLDEFLDRFSGTIHEFNVKIACSPSNLILQKEILHQIIESINDAVFENSELKYRYQIFGLDSSYVPTSQFGEAPWFTDVKLISNINDLLNVLSIAKLQDEKRDILVLIKILYYQCAQYELFNKDNNGKNKVCQVFSDNHLKWVLKLIELGFKDECISMLDFYHDLQGLIFVFDYLEDEIPTSYYEYYLDKYGYHLTIEICKFLINKGNLEKLFHIFNLKPNYTDLLALFLEDNKEEYGDVTWIEKILSAKYKDASEILFTVANTTNENKSNGNGDVRNIASGQTLRVKNFDLSVAKLSLLLDISLNEDTEATQTQEKKCIFLNDIETQLKIIETQDVVNKLLLSESFQDNLKNINTSNEFEKAFNEIYKELIESFDNKTFVDNANFKKNKQGTDNCKILTPGQLVFIISMVGDKYITNNTYIALKLLSESHNQFTHESFKFMVDFVWIECFSKYLKHTTDHNDENLRIINETLNKYFEDELYHHIPLPLSTNTFKGYSTDCVVACLQNTSAEKLNIDGSKLLQEFYKRANDNQLEIFIQTELPTLVGKANSQNGNRVIIDYKSGKLDYIP
ncbi:uncharacterized protein SCODWIG_01610 [Saccharomycodes ludwigii]|uniref:Nucleoporin Nup133/Nup155-like N-terminal domain-containing protein n=1 Tax=Saccharomycodes ludwigii TaxID=36035 RepID=A0A376B5J4_9ASCO|nr:uncharacterized protein SCODWIG_01610 [Saccharomycodes ludwigii]